MGLSPADEEKRKTPRILPGNRRFHRSNPLKQDFRIARRAMGPNNLLVLPIQGAHS